MNGTLIDTALDTNNSPIAIPSGFFSGFASATILRNDDVVLVESCALEGRKRLHIDLGVDCEVLLGVGDEEGEEDEEDEELAEFEAEVRAGLDKAKCLRPSVGVNILLGKGRSAARGHGGLETCRANRAAGGGRKAGATRTCTRIASIVVGVVEDVYGKERRELENDNLQQALRTWAEVGDSARVIPHMHVAHTQLPRETRQLGTYGVRIDVLASRRPRSVQRHATHCKGCKGVVMERRAQIHTVRHATELKARTTNRPKSW